MTDPLQLQQPLKESGSIRSVNFFNGRLLAGKDLSREQQARRESDWRLGTAVGEGVAYGLEVSLAKNSASDAPIVTVRSGLAFNRAGQSLRLYDDVDVALTRKLDAIPANCIFANCSPMPGGTYVAGAGVYLLTIAPAEKSEGMAATNGLDPSNVRCNTDATVEAVQFRLLRISPLRYADLDVSSKQFRNRLAYRCFGIEEREKGAADPWREDPAEYGLLDTLRGEGLSDCDAPLALIYWTADGIQFIDLWSVRRALLAPDALASLAFVARRRRLIEAQAMCAQFQQQLGELLEKAASAATLLMTDHFRYLPPFGILPLQTARFTGVLETSFMAGIARRPAPGTGQATEFIDARLLGALREQALAHAATCLTQDPAQKEFIWVYRVWQNVKAAAGDSSVQPVVAFASGQMPNLAVARFDLARLDYSNYASCCGGS